MGKGGERRKSALVIGGIDAPDISELMCVQNYLDAVLQCVCVYVLQNVMR